VEKLVFGSIFGNCALKTIIRIFAFVIALSIAGIGSSFGLSDCDTCCCTIPADNVKPDSPSISGCCCGETAQPCSLSRTPISTDKAPALPADQDVEKLPRGGDALVIGYIQIARDHFPGQTFIPLVRLFEARSGPIYLHNLSILR
jgi:hypothetical protein